METIKIFEGFAGLGAVSKAIERLDIPHELVGFSEIDKYAIKSFGLIHNIKEKLNYGDICLIDETKLPDLDLYTFGSPCQDFSIAGKQKGATWNCKDCGHEWNPLDVHYSKRDSCPNCNNKNINKTRSSLVVEALRIIRYKNPKYLLMENVKGLVGKQFKPSFDKIIEELKEYGYNIYWKVLNAKDYGIPQNRERVFVISIRKDIDDCSFKFPEGFDNGIRLKDLLESDVDEKYYISQEKTEKLLEKFNEEQVKKGLKNNMILDAKNGFGGVKTYEGICPTLLTNDFKEPKKVVTFNRKDGIKNEIDNAHSLNASDWRGLNRNQDQNAVVEVRPCLTPDRVEKRQNGRRFKEDGEPSFTLNTQDKHGILIINENSQAKVVKVGNTNPSGNGMNGCVYSENGLAPTVTTNKGEGNKILIENELKFICGIDTTNKWIDNEKDFSRNYKEGYRVYDSEGIACCQKTNGGGLGSNTGLYLENTYRIRKLTPLECLRLMGFDDEDYYILKENGISNSQIYKMAGNSIVVNVLEEIFKELFIEL